MCADLTPDQRDVVLEQNPSGETDRDCALLGWFCSKPDVQLTVSDGPGKTEVPDVSGDPADEAQQTLEDAGFDVTATDQSSADVEAGIVIDTDPAAGESVQAGSEITMYVSSGVKQVAVPPLVGLTLAAAAQRIAAKGLEYNSTEEESDRPAGEVISQSPDAGTKVDPGSTIEMVVSSGQPDTSVTVPSVVGKTQSEAESMLTGLGLVVGGLIEQARLGPAATGTVGGEGVAGRSSLAPPLRMSVMEVTPSLLSALSSLGPRRAREILPICIATTNSSPCSGFSSSETVRKLCSWEVFSSKPRSVLLPTAKTRAARRMV